MKPCLPLRGARSEAHHPPTNKSSQTAQASNQSASPAGAYCRANLLLTSWPGIFNKRPANADGCCGGPALLIGLRLLRGRLLHVAPLAVRPAHGQVIHVDARHGLAQVLGHLRQDLRVPEVGHRLDDGPRSLLGVVRLEDAAAHEDAVDAQLHAKCCVRGRGHPTRCEVHDGKLAVTLGLHHQVQRRAHLLREREDLVVVHGLQHADLLVQRADVAHGLDDVAGARLALRADHACSFSDTAESLTKVAASAHERHLELVLVHMVALVGHRQDLALVDAVDAQVLQNLGLDEVPDAALRHHRDGDRVDDLLDHLRVRHARHALLVPDVCWDALQGHDCTSARLLGNLRLLGVHDVHDDAALQHGRQALLNAVGALDDGLCSHLLCVKQETSPTHLAGQCLEP
mmetsp:Transcript_44521/g.111862  ORF Transcript_44521/g.111862 Transcript_44521/m.111862 type:complete len:401 (-) Transcript_44521:8-1210(-)